MEKAKVIKALELCGHVNNPFVSGISACEGCPYVGMDNCDEQMCADAAALLKANEDSKEPEYTHFEVYIKKGNLLKYFENNPNICCATTEELNRKRGYYAREREIQLIVKYRYERNMLFCKISCPENPMPTNDEFHAVSKAAVFRFLKENGFEFKYSFKACLFK